MFIFLGGSALCGREGPVSKEEEMVLADRQKGR